MKMHLTRRESEILSLMAQGKDVGQIAKILNITASNVANYKFRMKHEKGIPVWSKLACENFLKNYTPPPHYPGMTKNRIDVLTRYMNEQPSFQMSRELGVQWDTILHTLKTSAVLMGWRGDCFGPRYRNYIRQWLGERNLLPTAPAPTSEQTPDPMFQ